MDQQDSEEKELIRDLVGANGLLPLSHLPAVAKLGELAGEEPAQSRETLGRLLAEKLDDMVNNDFEGLVRLLYRIDISEQKLKLLLQTQQGTNAGRIMADLIIKRQLEKIKTRREYTASMQNSGESETGETEKW